MASSLRDLATNIVKLERFDGENFMRWQKKMHFLLTTIQVAYVLTSDPPREHNDETVEQIDIVTSETMTIAFVGAISLTICVSNCLTHIKLCHMQRNCGIFWRQDT